MTPLPRIDTKDAAGNPNGFLVPIWRADSGEKVEQVYLTVVEPGASKGPHLHMRRCGRFTCIKGAVELVTREDGRYHLTLLNALEEFATLTVPPGVPAQIRCIVGPAYVLNLPTPAWSAEDPDEHEVTDWSPPV